MSDRVRRNTQKLLPDTDAIGAAQVAECLREAVRDCRPRGEAEGIRVTISCGVAQLQLADSSLNDLLARADRALYQAKSSGRDQVSLSPAPE